MLYTQSGWTQNTKELWIRPCSLGAIEGKNVTTTVEKWSSQCFFGLEGWLRCFLSQGWKAYMGQWAGIAKVLPGPPAIMVLCVC